MSTSRETVVSPSISDVVSERTEPKIAGVLREPTIHTVGTDGVSIGYHWETADDRHTYLRILLSKAPSEPFAVARVNIDSEEIRGQGDALWGFVGSELQALSDRSGYPIMDMANVNEYSRRFPEADPWYVQVSDNEFHGLYLPTPVEQETVHAQPVHTGQLVH